MKTKALIFTLVIYLFTIIPAFAKWGVLPWFGKLTTPYIIAAPDSLPKFKLIATVVCSGAADDVAINNLISKMSGGGTIWLAPGTYNITNSIELVSKSGICITGVGGKGSVNIKITEGVTGFDLTGAKRCEISNLKIDGDGNSNTTGILITATSSDFAYQNSINSVILEQCTIGINCGSSSNYQVSENTFRNVSFSYCSTGISMLGQNTYNMSFYDCIFSHCGTGISTTNANFYAYNLVCTNSSVRDIYIASPMRRIAIFGGESEDSEQFVYIAAFSTNYPIGLYNIDISANASSNSSHFIDDESLCALNICNCMFRKGAGVYFNGWDSTTRPSSEYLGVKVFNSCIWKSSDSGNPTVSPNVSVHADGEAARSLSIKHVNYESP